MKYNTLLILFLQKFFIFIITIIIINSTKNCDDMQIKTDVLVIGAGPAGSIAARTVAQNGVNV